MDTLERGISHFNQPTGGGGTGPQGPAGATGPAGPAGGTFPFFPTLAALQASTTNFATGTVVEAGGTFYTVLADGTTPYHIATAGSKRLNFSGDLVTPDAFGADPTGVVDSTVAFNTAMQYAAANGKPGRSCGTYKMSGTLSPGGTYSWDWAVTNLNWGNSAIAGANITGFTELQYNPTGLPTTPSGKRVLIDLLGCLNSQNDGFLTITGCSPGASFKLSGRATVNTSIVAISCSIGNSADIVWNALLISGCGYGFWQGDQRGNGTQILPYTRWAINYLKMQLCIIPFECGQSGNGFDDMFISEMRITRCSGRSLIISSELGGGVAFMNGLAPGKDEETQLVDITAGSNQAILSAANTAILVGHTIVISDAGLNKGGTATHFAAAVTAKSGDSITLTLERNAEITATGKQFFITSGETLVQNSTWRFQQTYMEEIWSLPFRLLGGFMTGLIKVSGGDISSRYDCGVLLQEDAMADVDLHTKSVNNNGVKRLLGVSDARNVAVYNSNRAKIRVPGPEASSNLLSDPIGVVSLFSGHLTSAFPTDAPNEENKNLNLEIEYTDVTCRLQRHAVSGLTGVAQRLRNGVQLELGTPLLIATATNSGSFSAVSGGASTKANTAPGYLWHPVTAGKTYKVTVNASAVTGMALQIRWFLSTVQVGGVECTFARSNVGRYSAIVVAPAGVDRLAVYASTSEAFTLNEFTVVELLPAM